ncbi:MAG: VanZ family protein [Pseudomonadota bacterium]
MRLGLFRRSPSGLPTAHSSSAALLAWIYAGLVVYATLYPFSGWRLGGGSSLAFVTLPLPAYWTGFDTVANWLGYLPFGLLVFIAFIRRSWRAGLAWLSAVVLAAVLSFGLEFLQNFLPQRVPSNLDWLLNTLGGALGAALGWGLHRVGGIARWQTVRERWFVQPSAGGIALLLLWPVGLLFPLSSPFAMGQVVERAREGLLGWLSDTPLAAWAAVSLPPPLPHRTLTPTGEFVLIVLGLLAPCCLVFTVSRPGWRRVILLALTVGGGVFLTCLSTALSFGPEQALAWVTPVAWWAVAITWILATLLAWVSRRAAAALGLMMLAGLVALVTQGPGDPYFALSLQSWEQGRFIRFHGASQWVGWFWPYLAMAYLMSVVAGRYPHPRPVAADGPTETGVLTEAGTLSEPVVAAPEPAPPPSAPL